MNVLVDTDVVVDYLDGKREVVAIFSSPRLVPYCSSVTLVEVCASRSLGAAQKRATRNAVRLMLRVINYRDPSIVAAHDRIRSRFSREQLSRGDALIAATAIAKHMPLWTNNRRHFAQVEGLTLFDPATDLE